MPDQNQVRLSHPNNCSTKLTNSESIARTDSTTEVGSSEGYGVEEFHPRRQRGKQIRQSFPTQAKTPFHQRLFDVDNVHSAEHQVSLDDLVQSLAGVFQQSPESVQKAEVLKALLKHGLDVYDSSETQDRMTGEASESAGPTTSCHPQD